jgi:hypothetical protein
MTFIGKLGNVVLHCDKAHFDQCPDIVRTDGGKICSLGFDIAQQPTKMDRRIQIQAGQSRDWLICCRRYILHFNLSRRCSPRRLGLCRAAVRGGSRLAYFVAFGFR